MHNESFVLNIVLGEPQLHRRYVYLCIIFIFLQYVIDTLALAKLAVTHGNSLKGYCATSFVVVQVVKFQRDRLDKGSLSSPQLMLIRCSFLEKYLIKIGAGELFS